MKCVSSPAACLALALSGAAAGAWGVEVSKASGQAAGQTIKAETTRATDASHAMREGVVTRIDLQAGKIEIQGQWHSLVSGETQIYHNGHSARPDVLKVGQAIRYSVSASDARGKRLGVLYVR